MNVEQALTQAQSLLEQLEVKVAYQDDTIEQLNSVVFEQQRSIERLQKQMQLMIERMKSAQQNSSNINAEHELPPHY